MSLLTLVACEKNYNPNPAVEQYLNSGLTAQKAFDKIADCAYTATLTLIDKSGNTLGTQETTVSFDVSDKQNLSLDMRQTFSGRYVTNGITEQNVTLRKQEGGYIYSVTTNVESQNKLQSVDNDFAVDLLTALVYSDNGAYNSGGLYYGDVFMLKIYKYPPESFYVDEDSDLCVFDEKMRILRDDMGDVYLYQTTKINRDGLLMYDYEKYESVDQDYVMTSELTAEYEYLQAS